MLRNCPTCGKLLVTPEGTPCPACMAQDEALMARIGAFLDEGGSATMAGVIAGTGIPAAVIRRLLASGRITLGCAAPASCAVCGKAMEPLQGRMCASCARRVRAGAEVLRAAVRSDSTYHSQRLQGDHGRAHRDPRA